MEKRVTSGYKYLDWEMFLDLSDSDILNLCQVNKEMKGMCDNEEFWEWRYQKLHGSHKKEKLTWKQEYFSKKKEVNYFTDYIDKYGFDVFDYRLNLPIHKKDNKTIKVGDIFSLFYDKKKRKHYLEERSYYIDEASYYIVTNLNENGVILTYLAFYENQGEKTLLFPYYSTHFVNTENITKYESLFKKICEEQKLEKLNINIGRLTLLSPDYIHDCKSKK